jgi:hypothetical protein
MSAWAGVSRPAAACNPPPPTRTHLQRRGDLSLLGGERVGARELEAVLARRAVVRRLAEQLLQAQDFVRHLDVLVLQRLLQCRDLVAQPGGLAPDALHLPTRRVHRVSG